MKRNLIPQFLIAAPASGSGKTSVSMGLMGLLTQKGEKVQAFKCGPDYIDPLFHRSATGRPSVNLDTFMASDSHVKDLYAAYAQEAGVCIAEGAMGLFDGYDRSKGSSAEIARMLNLPAVLVVNARATAYSMAPLLYGFARFDPEVEVAGVIFNNTGSVRHERMLRQACEDVRMECFGCIRRNEEMQVRSRYLGLDISPDKNKNIIEAWADFISTQVDVERLLEKTRRPIHIYMEKEEKKENLRIAVALNRESFAFVYEETLRSMRRMGEVLFFDPETDHRLPENTGLLYLPGGYPEKRQKQLSGNHTLLREIREYIESGGRTLAECGGLVYLSREIRNEGGDSVNMVNAFPFSILNTKQGRSLTLGYRQLEYNGQRLRGHEFHYTQIAQDEAGLPPSAAQIFNAAGEAVKSPLYRYKNTLASYTHLYWGEADILALWKDTQPETKAI